MNNNRPVYHSKNLTKFCFYGYMNRLRSSREQEKETKRTNLEHPYGTIKWPWGFSYIMTKKAIKQASADTGRSLFLDGLRLAHMKNKITRKHGDSN